MGTSLAKNIRAVLKAKGLTHAAFIEQSGIAQGTFYALLRGEPPKKIETVKKLRALDVEIPATIVGLKT